MPGFAPATAPTAQGFWVASDAGPRARRVTWPATEGRFTVVVMNADGSRPVAADTAAGVTAPMLRTVWTGLYTAAALMLVAGALVVGLALPRPPVRATS